jgi:FKBP-type peptidyl-prolyl cis-trans isomerase
MPSPRTLVLPAVAALALALGACGDDDNDSAGSAAATTQTGTESSAPAPDETSSEISTDLSQKPAVSPPGGDPPTSLVKRDIVEGKGKVARTGDTVTVQYVGVNFSNGAEFDASWNSGQPFTFPLGAGQVIPGWDQGVKGMRVGGRRELIIPPDLAYGPQGSPPAIGPNETLVFVVDLEQVRKGG